MLLESMCLMNPYVKGLGERQTLFNYFSFTLDFQIFFLKAFMACFLYNSNSDVKIMVTRPRAVYFL